MSLFRSVFVAGVTTIIAILVSSGAAYAFARFKFKAKNGWLIGLLMSRMLPTASLIIPYFILFKDYNLIGTYQGLIITYLGFTIPFATWVLIGYFAALPIETERAARIDGCGRFGTLFRVILPMARSGIVSVAVIIFLLVWGELLMALIISTGSPVALFAPVLTSFAQVLGGVISPTLLATATVLGLVPIVIIATVFQRYITRLKIVDPVTVTEEKPFM
ncbi:MAG: ABC transporter permease subunit [Nitrososphaeria archaeon]|nr:ABC transporter permease subunit [Nitrososphaeria archaeon]NIQ33959.1 ABC transporter permease subunit [Nitrososphaeria archaeon]